jgi:hypothetical protein
MLLALACGDDEDKKSGSPDGDAGETGGRSGSGGSAAAGGGSSGGAASGGAAAGGADAGPDGSPEAGSPAVSLCAGKTGQDQIDCGGYIVEHVAACGDCHSGRLPNGAIDPATFLAGNAAFADLDPADDTAGLVPTPNLTQLGADGWTAAEIVTAIREGRAKGDRGLFPIMPYPTFHNMADEDAEAIAAYLLSLTPITNAIPARQPLPFPAQLPVPTVPLAAIPDAVNVPAASEDEVALGKYLAGQVGVCLECHTQRTPQGALDMAKAYAGGEPYAMPSPPFPPVVYSLNVTPDPGGISGWTPQMVQTVIKQGTDPDGNALCPPMPYGPMGAFGGMTDEHALAIGEYLTRLAPVANSLADGGAFPRCVMPGPPPGDGGTPDASPGDAEAPADASSTD